LLAEVDYRFIQLEAWDGIDLARTSMQVAAVDTLVAVALPLVLLDRRRWLNAYAMSVGFGIVGLGALAAAMLAMQQVLLWPTRVSCWRGGSRSRTSHNISLGKCYLSSNAVAGPIPGKFTAGDHVAVLEAYSGTDSHALTVWPRLAVRFTQSDRPARSDTAPVVSRSCSVNLTRRGDAANSTTITPGPMARSNGTDGLMAPPKRGSSLWA
jgi:hypothetical protein